MKKEPRYNILKTGDFYFPVKDVDKKFTILETLDFEIDKKKLVIAKTMLKEGLIDLKAYAEPIWEDVKKFIKKNKKYKDCWFVPLKIDELGNRFLASVDILKPAR